MDDLILYYFSSESDATIELLHSPDATQLLYNAIRVHVDGPNHKVLGDVELTIASEFSDVRFNALNIYGKLKNLHDSSKLLDFLDDTPDLKISPEASRQILLYLNMVNPEVQIPANKWRDGASGETGLLLRNMHTYIDLCRLNREMKEDFFISHTPTDISTVDGIPEEQFNRRALLRQIFDTEYIWIARDSYRGSVLLEEMVMNSLQMLCFNVRAYDYRRVLLVEKTMESVVVQFIRTIRTNGAVIELQANLRAIINELKSESCDKNVFYKLMKSIYSASSEIQNVDLAIEKFLTTHMQPINVKLLLLSNIPSDICGPTSENDLKQFKNIVDTMSEGVRNIENYRSRICVEKFKSYLYTFRFRENSIIYFNSHDGTIQLVPNQFKLSNEKLPENGDFVKKFTHLKYLLDLKKPYHVFEAIVKTTLFSYDECNLLLHYVFKFESYICTLLASAVHAYNIGTISFDIPQMYAFVTQLPMEKLGGRESMCSYQTSEIGDLSLSLLYRDVFPINNIFTLSNFNDLQSLIDSIKMLCENIYELCLVCSQHLPHEMYIIQYIQQAQSLDEYTEVILCLLLLNSDISDSERIILDEIIESKKHTINYSAVTGALYSTKFLPTICSSPIYNSIPAHYAALMDAGVDISCDYELLLANAPKFDSLSLFESIVDFAR